MQQAMLASPPALERAAIIGAAAAKAQLPKYSTYMRQNGESFPRVDANFFLTLAVL